MAKQDLAIIVVTKNEEKNLPRLLASLQRNEVDPGTVIIVDAGSTDTTVSIARAFGAQVLSERPNLSVQRNAGARHTSARWLVMLDADMELPDGFIDELVTLLEEGNGCVILPEHSIAAGFLARARGFERDLQHGDLTIEAARAFTAELFWQCGGYNESIGFGGEDWFLAKAMYDQVRPARTHRVVLHHEPESSVATIVRRYFFYGRGRYRLFRANPRFFAELTNPIRPSTSAHWRDYMAHPVLTIGVVFYKLLTYGAGLCGFAVEAMHSVFARRQLSTDA